MSKLLVAVFSYNRPNLLRLTMDYLLGQDNTHITIFDDVSDLGCQRVLAELMLKGAYVSHNGVHNAISRTNYHQRAARCGVLRQRAVDMFLRGDFDYLQGRFDYLLFKDDDVLVTWKAVEEAIKDYEFLKSTDWAKIGALTLHGICTHKGYQAVDGKVFAELSITGEANVLFDRDTLLQVGNHFGPEPKGFADNQFHAIRAAGLKYYDRVWPPYEVQHLGFGPDSSTIHRRERTPVWNLGPYQCTYKRRDYGQHLKVEGFGLGVFTSHALRFGAERAAELALESGNE